MENVRDIDHQQELYQALKSVSDRYASFLIDPASLTSTHSLPFLRKYVIYEVEHMYRPHFFLFGYAPGMPVYILSGHPQNFALLAKSDGISLATEQDALAYAIATIELTRSPALLCYLVSRPHDIRFGTLLSPQESARRDAASGVAIKAPGVTIQQGLYVVELYVIRDKNLEKHTMTISKDGELYDNREILIEHLPLAAVAR